MTATADWRKDLGLAGARRVEAEAPQRREAYGGDGADIADGGGKAFTPPSAAVFGPKNGATKAGAREAARRGYEEAPGRRGGAAGGAGIRTRRKAVSGRDSLSRALSRGLGRRGRSLSLKLRPQPSAALRRGAR